MPFWEDVHVLPIFLDGWGSEIKMLSSVNTDMATEFEWNCPHNIFLPSLDRVAPSSPRERGVLGVVADLESREVKSAYRGKTVYSPRSFRRSQTRASL